VRRLLALVGSIIFVDAMLFTALTPLLPRYAEEFDLSKAGAGVLVGAFGAGALLGGVPGGIVAAKFGPKRAVVGGLVLLGIASFAVAAADSASTLGAARFVQGLASTTTWAGALAWIAVVVPRNERGQAIGIAFGAAVFGAVLGPMFGGVAELVGIRASFAVVGVLTLAFAAFAALPAPAPPQPLSARGLLRAFHDPRFLGGLWLNTLPAMLFGMLIVLAPLALDDHGWSTLAIASLFFAAGLLEVVINPILGRASDRAGRLLPIRIAVAASIIVAAGLAFATQPVLIAVLVAAASLSFGACYTPGMALTSDRADVAGLAQGLAFGFMNTAWSLGATVGPTLGGALAEAWDDTLPYLLGSGLCALTLLATWQIAAQRVKPRAA
jgi:predicted MFS family arabinose efflux permease